MLILSVDHEVFGNGSGCLDACIKRPVDRILDVADKFSAPVTFFVEALEFEAMQRANIENIIPILEQLTDAYSRGHDLQLHIHPQWYNAIWDGDHWQVNEKLWRMGNLDAGLAYDLLSQGKNWLEGLMAERFPEYKCIAFRAGGWCIQPSGLIVSALIKLGFKIDSTVAPGLRNAANGEWADFRKVPYLPFWKTERDVCRSGSSGLWEVPITTGKIGRMQHLQSVRLARSFGSGGMADGCVGSYQGANSKLQSIKGKVAKFKDLGNVMLDISTMPADVLIEISKQWLKKYSGNDLPIPLVAIMHTKNFTDASERNMYKYLTWAKEEGIEMVTYGRWVESVHE